MDDLRWRVAVIDSGFDLGRAADSIRFVDVGDSVVAEAPLHDPTGHGTAVAGIIQTGSCELMSAQVIDAQGRSTPAAVAVAVMWALTHGARLIHLSLGVAEDRTILATAIAEAVDAGVVVVASTPARGATTFPAQYAGVLRATGDARCSDNQISVLDSTLHFGGCAASTLSSGRNFRGASIGAAHVTRFIVSRLAPARNGAVIGGQLAALATFRGRERKRSNAAA